MMGKDAWSEWKQYSYLQKCLLRMEGKQRNRMDSSLVTAPLFRLSNQSAATVAFMGEINFLAYRKKSLMPETFVTCYIIATDGLLPFSIRTKWCWHVKPCNTILLWSDLIKKS